MPSATDRYDFDRVVRLVLSAGTIALLFWLLSILSDVLVPFAIAVLGAYLLNPIVNAFERKTGGRGSAVALTLGVALVAILVTVPFVIYFVGHEVSSIVEVLSDEKLKQSISSRVESISWFDAENLERIKVFVKEQLEKFSREEFDTMKDNLEAKAIEWGDRILAGGLSFLGGILSAVFALGILVVILLYLVFLMMDFNSFQANWKNSLPPDYRDAIVSFVEEFSLAMGRYFRGQFLVAFLCGLLFAVGFSVVQIRMAVFLGLFVGLLNMVPYLQILGLGPALVLALLRGIETGGGVTWPIVGVLIVFGLVQVVQDGVLVPLIMGKSTGLKPWVIMLSIFVWGKLLGFLGLVLAIPLSCLGLAYYRRMVLKKPATV